MISALGFSIGFGFMFLAISVPFLGLSMVQGIKKVLPVVGGLILILVGLFLLGFFRIPALAKYYRIFNYGFKFGNSLWSVFTGSLLVGLSFASGWAPCVGPVMLGILSLISNQQEFFMGIIMLLFTTLGLISSFMLVSVGIIMFGNIVSKIHKFSIVIEKFLGLVFIVIGLGLLFSGVDWVFVLPIGVDWLQGLTYQLSTFSIFSLLVSYIAGIFLFISPCTLPVVIPYLFFLTGVGIEGHDR